MRSWLALFENASGVHAMPGIAKPKGLEWDDEKMQAVLSLFPDFFQADDSAQYKHLLPLAFGGWDAGPPWIESHHRQPGAQSATFTSTPSCHTSRPG